MLTVTQKYFVDVIKCAVNERAPRLLCPLESDSDWKQLQRLVRRNLLDSLFYEELKNESAVPSWLLTEWEERCCFEMLLDTRQQYEIERIVERFTAAGVPFAFVKGSLLKTAYPRRYMRYMSDIDVLILPRDRTLVRECMESIGATIDSYDGGDENFKTSDGLMVETHGYMFFRKGKKGTEMYSDLRYFDCENNRLTEEGYALQLMMHMINNLCQMGLGIRYVLDLWVYRHRYPNQPDWAAVFDELRCAGFDKVADTLVRLSEHWFGDELQQDILPELEEYVIASSLYGMPGQLALNNASLAGGKTKAVFHRLFLSKEEYCKRYPWIVEHPHLLPLAWVVRIVQMLRHHGKQTFSWTSGLVGVQRDMIHKRRDLLKRIGFKF